MIDWQPVVRVTREDNVAFCAALVPAYFPDNNSS
jgi:hypothetical protein